MIFCLMGPTACGKTQLAVELVKHFPFEIISVDSAMVYREMNIGTAKPTPDILQKAPHRLIDVRDPKETYSVGDFYQDVWLHIEDIITKGHLPLLVGGTMMYFHAHLNGLASLPKGNLDIRHHLQVRGQKQGWEHLHDELSKIDSVAASRIMPHDQQRIQRALEVYYLTGKPISSFQRHHTAPRTKYVVHQLGLVPEKRTWCHQQIAGRFSNMLAQGFVDEVMTLASRHDLNRDLPSLRAVGYREMLSYLAQEISYDTMCEKSIIATRQLVKRQLTWLRRFTGLHVLFAEANNLFDQAAVWVEEKLGK